MITSSNPADEKLLGMYEFHTKERVNELLNKAVSTQSHWSRQSVELRCSLLPRVATVLRKNKAEYARIITQEMGKPIAEAEGEIEKCAWTCEFYAQAAPKFLADQPVDSNASESSVVFDPLGVLLAIMPWNYPFWQFIRFSAPALAAGNVALLRHASNVPQCALALEAAFREAGAPEGLVTTLMVEHKVVSELIDDPRIAALTLTGSTDVGKQIAAQAGRAMKKQVLELGGSDPFIVLADADIELAAKTAVKARFSNTGQSCISSKRFIVEASVADRFVELLCEGVTALKIGNPLDRDTTIGPMARGNLRDDLHAQVERSIAAGAKLLMGGHPVEGPGYFYAPTVLDHVTPQMAAGCEETFGPVAAIIRVADVDEALHVANNTEFGLGAALWTGDLNRARDLVRRIEAGAVFVNGLVASDARLPFGGIKQSGYGRELGEFGIREFTNVKTVWIGPAK